MPKPPMKARVIRVPDALWDAAKAKAARQNVALADVIRRALQRYVKRVATLIVAALTVMLAFTITVTPAQAQDAYHLAWARDTVYVVDTTGPAWPVGRAVTAMYDPSSQLRVIYTLHCPSTTAQCVTVEEKTLAWPQTGLTTWSYTGNQILSAHVQLSRAFLTRNYTYRFSIVEHELGHAVGLAHSAYRTSVMYPTIGYASSLGWRDYLYLRAAYGGNE